VVLSLTSALSRSSPLTLRSIIVLFCQTSNDASIAYQVDDLFQKEPIDGRHPPEPRRGVAIGCPGNLMLHRRCVSVMRAVNVQFNVSTAGF
jgi:hypothetical protein